MALIKCPECGKEVSDSAKTCPNCGYPIAKNIKKDQSSKKGNSRKSVIIICGIAVIVIAAIVIILLANKTSNTDEELFGSAPIGGISKEIEGYISQYDDWKKLNDPDTNEVFTEGNLTILYMDDENGDYYYITHVNSSDIEGIIGRPTYKVRDDTVFEKSFLSIFASYDTDLSTLAHNDEVNYYTDPQKESYSCFENWLNSFTQTYGEYSSYDEYGTGGEEYHWDNTDYDYEIYLSYQELHYYCLVCITYRLK